MDDEYPSGDGSRKLVYKLKSKPSLVMKRDMQCGVDGISARIMAPPWVAKGNAQLCQKSKHSLVIASDSGCNPDTLSEIHKDCETVFQRKRQKLQELVLNALAIERERLTLYGSKSIAMLLERLDIPNYRSIGRTSQKEDREITKSLSIELKKTTLQSNFQLETSGSVDSKLGLQKACAPCNMLGDVDGLGHVYCGDNLLEKENLNIHQADQFSLSLPWKVEEIHQHGSGVYQSSILHGVRMPTNSEDVDFDADSACNSRKLNQGIDSGHETVPDNRFQNCPEEKTTMSEP